MTPQVLAQKSIIMHYYYYYYGLHTKIANNCYFVIPNNSNSDMLSVVFTVQAGRVYDMKANVKVEEMYFV